MTDPRAEEPNGGIAKAEGQPEPRHAELETAFKRLDHMVPELTALSKQMTEQSAATANTQATGRPAAAASGAGRLS
jgi:hypothetical protein